MPIDGYLAGKSFDPEYLRALNRAFDEACAILGVTENAPRSRARVAKRIIQLADGERDPEAIGKAVVSYLKSRH